MDGVLESSHNPPSSLQRSRKRDEAAKKKRSVIAEVRQVVASSPVANPLGSNPPVPLAGFVILVLFAGEWFGWFLSGKFGQARRAGFEGCKKFFKNAVDENFETRHNLASLLLTNTTLRSDAGKTAEQKKVL